MNPFFIAAVSRAVVRSLTRQCTRCGHQQVVSESKAHQTVACDICGATLMPNLSNRASSAEDDPQD